MHKINLIKLLNIIIKKKDKGRQMSDESVWLNV